MYYLMFSLDYIKRVLVWTLLILNFISQGSCQSTKNLVIHSYELKLEKTWVLENHDKIIPQLIQYKDNFFWCYNQTKQKIYQYDLHNQKLIQEIDLKDFLPLKFASMVVQGYYPLDTNHLLLILNGGNEPHYFHDSLMVLIDLQNQNYRHLSIDSLLVTNIRNPIKKNNHFWFLLSSNTSQLLSRNQLLFPLKSFGGELGDTLWNENKDKDHLFVYNIEKQKVVKNIPFEYPSKLGEYYPRDFTKFSTCWINANLIAIAFQHTSSVYFYDFQTHQYKSLEFKSYLIEKIPSSAEYLPYIQRKNDDITLAKYMAIGFQPNRNYLYRFVRHPAPSENVKKSVYSLLLFNMKTHQIHENILPYYMNPHLFIPYQNGFLTFDEKNSNIQEGKWSFSYYKINHTHKKKSIEFQAVIDSLYQSYLIPEDFKKYYKEVFQKPLVEGNYLLVPLERSCPSYLLGLIKKLENEKSKWCPSSLKIILIGSEFILKENFKNLQIPYPSDCYLIDYENKFHDYLLPFTNFRLITIDENEQIIDDRILNPKDLPLIEKLINSLN